MNAQYLEGFQAYHNQVHLNDNPYVDGVETEKYNQWSFGWLAAEEEFHHFLKTSN